MSAPPVDVVPVSFWDWMVKAVPVPALVVLSACDRERVVIVEVKVREVVPAATAANVRHGVPLAWANT